MNIFYKHSRIKQYLKEGRAWRIESVINSPDDIGVQRRLHNLPELVTRCRDANRRILEVQHAGQGCAIGPTLFEGQRTGALRFGDQRTMALAGALCLTLFAVTGFTNRSLRALVAGLLGIPYSASQMSYDLRRLRLHRLIRRIDGQHRYLLTDEGRKYALFYTRFGERVVGPMFDTDRPNAPPKLVRALDTIGRCIDDSFTHAGLAMAA